MDKSEINIKMCEKAGEIQSLAPNPKIIIFGGNDYYFHLDRDAPLVWLPRQDQLQEMLFEGQALSEEIPCAMLKLLYEYGHVTYNKDAEYWHACKSMEQLWLAFVMKEKYNKVWDGENWVEINVAGRTNRKCRIAQK